MALQVSVYNTVTQKIEIIDSTSLGGSGGDLKSDGTVAMAAAFDLNDNDLVDVGDMNLSGDITIFGHLIKDAAASAGIKISGDGGNPVLGIEIGGVGYSSVVNRYGAGMLAAVEGWNFKRTDSGTAVISVTSNATMNGTVSPAVWCVRKNGSTYSTPITSTADPTTTELPNDGDQAICVNSTSGNVFLAVNNGATIYKVQLT